MVVVDTIVPVFAIVGLGYWLAGRRPLDVATLADVALMITSPALVFSVLSRTALAPERWLGLAGGALCIVGGTAALGALYAWRAGPGLRGLVLPCAFWNAGNMGLPYARLAFGDEGLAAGTILFVVLAMLQFSAGIWIAKGAGGLREALRLPLLWAGAAGLVVAGLGLPVPGLVMEPVRMLGDMAIPLMLLNLGLQLRRLQVTDLRHSLVAVAIRMGGGVALALAFAALAGLHGVDRQVLVLAGALPAAVVNAVIAERYDTAPTLVASAIVLGTFASLLSVPAILLLVS